MFDDVAHARLSITLPGWLLRLCLMRSMCACTQWLLCCALAQEASLYDTRCSSLWIVVVVTAFARCDKKMPVRLRTRLVVDIPRRHCRSCCHCRRRVTHRECKALLTTLLSLSPLDWLLSPPCNTMCYRALEHKALLPLPSCNAMCCCVLAHKAWLPLLPCDVTCCRALAHKAWSLLPPCDVTCCCALAHKAWSPSPPCNAMCCHALAHKALSLSLLRNAMCQQLVHLCTLLLQYEARVYAH
jgi:hypothetical protein